MGTHNKAELLRGPCKLEGGFQSIQTQPFSATNEPAWPTFFTDTVLSSPLHPPPSTPHHLCCVDCLLAPDQGLHYNRSERH